jgi:hypothetical protein
MKIGVMVPILMLLVIQLIIRMNIPGADGAHPVFHQQHSTQAS